MKFKNPVNDYVETANYAWLWALVFGGFYFIVKGVWRHVIIWFTFLPVAWLIYPFFASGIVERNYLRNGWIKVDFASEIYKKVS